MPSVKLVAKSKITRKKEGTTPIYIQYSYDPGKRTLINTGYHISPKHWNYDRDIVKKSYEGYDDLNDKLKELLKQVKSIYKEAIEKGKDPTIEYVLDAYNNPVKLKKLNFFEILDVFIEGSKKRVVTDVIKDYNSIKKHLMGYEKFSKSTINFENFSYSFYQGFVNYLTYDAIKPNKEKGLAINTVGKQIKNLKVFLKDCIRKELCKEIDLSNFKTVTEEVDKIYLNEDEINKIIELDLSDNEELDITRDYFIIGCKTGLRFSDFSNIKPQNIKNDEIHIKQKKTHKTVKIPIKPEVRIIFEKYSNNLPEIDSFKFNKKIKIIGEKAGIKENIELVYKKGNEKVKSIVKKHNLITSHTCRRSFCTNEYIAGTPIIYIMKISGHKTAKSFMQYLKIDEEMAAKKLKEIWNERSSQEIIPNQN